MSFSQVLQAKLTSFVLQGRIASFDKVKVHLYVLGKKELTTIPRSFLVGKLNEGDFVRFEMNEDDLREFKQVNQ